MKLKISVSESEFLNETPKLFVNSLRRSLREGMEHHQKQNMPKHFKDSHAAQYNYKARNEKWVERKRRGYFRSTKSGTRRPFPQVLVWKGTLKQTVLGGGHKTRATVTARRVAGYLKWPNVPFYYIASNGRQVEREVKAVSKREAAEHAKRTQERTTELMKMNRVYYTRRRKVK